MMHSTLFTLCAIFICLGFSSFFSAVETALTAASRGRMLQLAKTDERAQKVNHLLSRPGRLIGTILLCNNVTNIAASAMATGLLVSWLGEKGILIATVIMSFVIVAFSELLPKTLAFNNPDRMALATSRLITFFVTIAMPLVHVMDWLVSKILHVFGMRSIDSETLLSAHEELRGTVALLHRKGGVVKDERDMLGGLLDLRDLSISDVMVHRTKMLTINGDMPPSDILHAALSSPYTRLPLCQGSAENIVGLLHVKDLLRVLEKTGGDASKINIYDVARPAWFIPDTTSVAHQLKAFLSRKTHCALVVDEYGEVMGLVTLEDILEEIVGDIKDEHDVTVRGVRPTLDGSVVVDGQVPIRDLNRALDWELPDEKATTIAGLVIHEAQVIPDTGQTFTFYGFRFQIVRRQRNRITAVRITPIDRSLADPKA
jgi:Mg2+/Co2+ transporter CorB